MLRPVDSLKSRASNSRFAIVASEYNARYVDSMLRAAQSVLKRAGAREVQVVRVPGAYEVPLIASSLARQYRQRYPFEAAGRLSNDGGRPHDGAVRDLFPSFAIICLGVILRGETVHAAHIGEAVSRALMDIQLRYEVPVVHEVLLLENEAQARARCLDPKHNRGTEAAQTALAMADLFCQLAAVAPRRRVGSGKGKP